MGRTTHDVAFNECDIGSEPRRISGCVVACWATTYDNNPLVRHDQSVRCRSRVTLSGHGAPTGSLGNSG